MVSIQEKIANHFKVEESSVHPSYIVAFKEALMGFRPYDSEASDIELWEDFLLTWLNGGVYEEKREYMKLIYHTFRELFPYDGILYRGMMSDFEGALYPMEVASYSSSDEVAFYFAGTSEQYGVVDAEFQGVTIEVQAEGAFAFDEFLRRVAFRSQNLELLEEIEERLWEEEKIYSLPAYVLEGI